MNKLNNKEEKIKNILGDLEIDINTNDIWADIESKLPPTKRKRRFGFYILFGMIALGLFALLWNNNSHQNSNALNEQYAVNSTNTENTKANTTIPSEGVTKNADILLHEKKSISPNSLEVDNHPNTQIHPSKKNIKHNTSTSPKIISQQKETHYSIENSTLLKTEEHLADHSTINFSIHTPAEQSIVDNKTIVDNLDRQKILALSNVPTLSQQLLEITQRELSDYRPSIITPSHYSGRRLILQFKLGANQNSTSISNINSIGEFDGSEFNFERDRLGLSGTFAIGVENRGWRFLAGISYHHHVSTYQRDDIQIVKDPTSGIEYYKISTDGVSTTQNGTVVVTAVRDNDISFHRQHRAIDFHATLGKRLWSYKGLSLIADAGIGINTITNTSGYFLKDSAFGFTKITDDNHPYKINTHWNALASMEIGYDFGNTRLGLSPFIRYNPNSITSQTHLYTLKNSQVGMQLSLTYSPTGE